MTRFNRIIVFAALALLTACAPKAVIDGELADLASSEVVVKLLDVNRYAALDTVRVDETGKFSYSMEIEEGQPEFVYIFSGDRKLASLLLSAGDRVSVVSDSLGNTVVSGSEESLKLIRIEKRHADAMSALKTLDGDSKALTQKYIQYYRDCVRYVMENSSSLTVVPVFYQTLGEGLPVFSQPTDAILFNSVADSLEQAYPDSRYVKALRAEAERRSSYLELQNRFANADEVGYPDIELPDLQGCGRKLSEMDSEVVMIYFWSASQASQNAFNIDVLKPLYEDYHHKGFDIYQVSFDVDKALWASTVRGQNLPWTNVCDSRGVSSPYITMYNIPALPVAFILAEGELVDGQIVDEKSLRTLLDRLLK